MVTSKIVGVGLFTKESLFCVRSDPNSPTLRKPSNCETETSSAFSYDNLSRSTPWPPSTPAVFDELAACRAHEEPHHRCKEAHEKLLAVCALMHYTTSPQRFLLGHHWTIISQTVESPILVPSRKQKLAL